MAGEILLPLVAIGLATLIGIGLFLGFSDSSQSLNALFGLGSKIFWGAIAVVSIIYGGRLGLVFGFIVLTAVVWLSLGHVEVLSSTNVRASLANRGGKFRRD